MSRTRRKPNVQRTRVWQPMQEAPLNPEYVAAMYPNGLAAYDIKRLRAFTNDIYSCVRIDRTDKWSYLTIKRHDRVAVHDWRHLQAIKTEVCGAEREAVELYPAESRLMDEANQYHLWVAPEGETLPFGDHTGRRVFTPEELRELDPHGKARQRALQPGLPGVAS
jgi:hypothetical protein